MICIACHEPRDGCHETSDGPICPACLSLAMLSPSERKARQAEGRTGPRDAAHANLGVPTEARAIASAERMRREMGIRLDKVPTPWRICGKLGAYRKCVQVERAIVDMLGFDASGKVLVVEIKSVSSSDRFLLSDLRRSRPHQVEYLEHASRSGARAFLLVDFPPRGCWYLVPWEAARRMVRILPEDEACRPYLADREMFLLPAGGAR